MLTSLVIGVATGVIYGLLALGVVLVYRGSRVLSFAQGEIGTFALYISWLLTVHTKIPWVAGLAPTPRWLVGAMAAIIGAGLLGFVFERLVVRRMADASRLSVAVATIGLLTALVIFEVLVWSPNGRSIPPPIGGTGVNVLGYIVSPTQFIAFGVVIALGLGLAALFRFTDFGLGAQAAAEDEGTASLVGVRVGRVSAFTWVASSVIAAIAALLIEPTIGVFAPGFISGIFVFGLAAALLGGLSSLPGAFIGGIVVGIAEAELIFVLRDTPLADALGTKTVPGINRLIIFVIILAVLLVRPAGLLSSRQARLA